MNFWLQWQVMISVWWTPNSCFSLWNLEMEHFLERHFCTPEIHHCPGFLRRHFPAAHRMVMDEYMHSDLICTAWSYCPWAPEGFCSNVYTNTGNKCFYLKLFFYWCLLSAIMFASFSKMVLYWDPILCVVLAYIQISNLKIYSYFTFIYSRKRSAVHLLYLISLHTWYINHLTN